jgi:hypothetical protein
VAGTRVGSGNGVLEKCPARNQAGDSELAIQACGPSPSRIRPGKDGTQEASARDDKGAAHPDRMHRCAEACDGECMRVYGIDFTSSPGRGKPITCLACVLDGNRLQAQELSEWKDFEEFEGALRRPGPWIAGIDFPFGQSRHFIESIGWPMTWAGYVEHVKSLGRKGFREALDAYRKSRPAGDREHRRAADIAAGSISPQRLSVTPVGLMFFEGAPRLRDAGVTIPGLQNGDPDRIVVEAYPGVLARSIIGPRSYKQDTKAKQTAEQREERKDLLRKIVEGAAKPHYGITVRAPMELADDPGADHLDALLCAIQAGWAWTRRNDGFGLPWWIDPLEGWIADPAIANTRV